MRDFLFATQVNIRDALPNVTADQARIQLIMNVVFGIMAAVAVLIIVIAGFKMILSRGDPQGIGKARNAIVDAAIGLAVIALAYTIVSVALSALGG